MWVRTMHSIDDLELIVFTVPFARLHVFQFSYLDLDSLCRLGSPPSAVSCGFLSHSSVRPSVEPRTYPDSHHDLLE